jgi:hypothetical protein
MPQWCSGSSGILERGEVEPSATSSNSVATQNPAGSVNCRGGVGSLQHLSTDLQCHVHDAAMSSITVLGATPVRSNSR